MKPAIMNNDRMMFFDRTMEAQRSQLLTVMADAVSECRTAADQAAELSETGQIGLLLSLIHICSMWPRASWRRRRGSSARTLPSTSPLL